MSAKNPSFRIQVRSVAQSLWHEPTSHPYDWQGKVVAADSVEALRDAIREVADARTLNFREHVRIITYDGRPVERWKIKPGKAWKAWRRW